MATLLAALASWLLVSHQGPDFWLPMTFILVGVGLFLWEVTMPGFFVAIPATVAVILGLVGLFIDGFLTNPGWVLLVGILVAAPTTYATMRLYRRLAPPDAAPTTTTGESLVGKTGRVTVAVNNETTKGKVRIEGVIWSAKSQVGPIAVGEVVEVTASRGVHVIVQQPARPPADPSPAAPSPASDASSESSTE